MCYWINWINLGIWCYRAPKYKPYKYLDIYIFKNNMAYIAGSPIKNIAIQPAPNRSTSPSRSLGILCWLAVESWLIFLANWMMHWQSLMRAHVIVEGLKSSKLSSLNTTFEFKLWHVLPYQPCFENMYPCFLFQLFHLVAPPIEVPAWLGSGHQDSWRWIRQSRIHQGRLCGPAEPQAARSRSEAVACLSTLFPFQAIQLIFVCILVNEWPHKNKGMSVYFQWASIRWFVYQLRPVCLNLPIHMQRLVSKAEAQIKSSTRACSKVTTAESTAKNFGIINKAMHEGSDSFPSSPELFIQEIPLVGPFDQVWPGLLPLAATAKAQERPAHGEEPKPKLELRAVQMKCQLERCRMWAIGLSTQWPLMNFW